MPSTVAYVSTSVAIAVTVFCLLWWIMASVGDEAPWLPAGMAAGFVVLVAVGAREVMVRRAWARHTMEMERHSSSGSSSGGGGESASQSRGEHASVNRLSVRSSAQALRALQQRLADAEAKGAQQPQAHLEAYRLCEQYLSNTGSAIRSSKTTPDVRAALHAGHERVRELKRHHLLAWARGETKRVMDEARRRVRVSVSPQRAKS
jgi:hypothetical protein